MNPRRRVALVLLALTVPAIALAWSFGTKGDGKMTTEARRVEGFKRVVLHDVIDAQIHEGPYAVSLTIDQNLQSLVTTEVQGDTLHVSTRSSINPSHGTKVEISLPEFHGASALGAGDLDIRGVSQAREIKLNTQASGDIHYEGAAQSIEVTTLGSGDVTLRLSGAVQKVDVATRGSGDIKVEGGQVDALRASTAGSGDIDTRGTPAQAADLSTHGSGDIKATLLA